MLDETIYLEELPPFVLGSSLKSHLQILIMHNIFRLGIIIMVVLSIPLLMGGKEDVLNVFIPLSGLAISLCLIWSEWYIRDHRRSSVPIKIYPDRIVLYSFIYERILGYNGSIKKEEIERIEIKRGALTQNVERGKTFFWEDAPVAFYVVLRNGRRRYSGLRNPGRVVAITDLLRERWGIPVIDEGEGWGSVKKFFNGKEYE